MTNENTSKLPALLLETAGRSRRRFMTQAGAVTFSGVAVALLSNRSTALAAGTNDDAVAQDIR